MDPFKLRAIELLRLKYPEYHAFSMDEIEVLAYWLWLNSIYGKVN